MDIEKLKIHLTAISKRDVLPEDSDFDCFDGYPDAYDRGVRDGETLLAEELLGMLKEDSEK